MTTASLRIDSYGKPGHGWRIASITFTAPPGLPGLRQSSINTIRVGDTSGPWVGWEFEVDGDALLMISPPGWVTGTSDRKGAKVTVYEVSRALAAIAWEYEVPVHVVRETPPGGTVTTSTVADLLPDLERAEAETAAMVAANEATIAAAVAAFASPLPAAAPVERDEPPDEPVVPARRGPGRPRKAP